MVEYIIGHFVYNDPIIKQVKYVKANNNLEALREYARDIYNPSSQKIFQCIGYYEGNNTYMIRDYTCNIDWDSTLPIIKFPIKWITQSKFDKKEFKDKEDK